MNNSNQYSRRLGSIWLALAFALISTFPASSYSHDGRPSMDGGSPSKRTIPQRPDLADGLCSAEQVRLSPSGNYYATVGSEYLPFSGSAMFEMPTFRVGRWPTNGQLAADNLPFVPSVKAATFFNDDTLIVTTVFGANVGLERVAASDWKKSSRELFSGQKGEFVYRPAYLYVEQAPDLFGKNVATENSANYRNATLEDGMFKSSREYTGLVSRTLISNDIYEIASDESGRLFWRKNFGTEIPIEPTFQRFSNTDISFYRLNNNQVAIAGRGLFWPSPSAVSSPSTEYPLYSLPVTDRATSTLTAFASPNRIIPLTSDARRLSAKWNSEVKRWVEKGWYLQFMTHTSSTGRSILLFRSIYDPYNSATVDSNALVFMEQNQPIRRVVCYAAFKPELISGDATNLRAPQAWDVNPSSAPTESVNLSYVGQGHGRRLVASVPKLPLKTEVVDFTSNNNRLGIWVIQPQSRIIGTAVIVRGGPFTNVFGRSIGPIESELLAKGLRILVVEYSGAVNTAPDIGQRLGLNRNASIKADAETLLEFLRLRHYTSKGAPLVLVAESFGSALGAELLATRPEVFSKAIFLVPAGKWHNNRLAPISTQNERTRRGQILIDRLVYGVKTESDEREIEIWYNRIREVSCGFKDITFVFGSEDDAVNSADWKQDCGNSDKFHVLLGATHHLQNDTRTIDIIKNELNALTLAK